MADADILNGNIIGLNGMRFFGVRLIIFGEFEFLDCQFGLIVYIDDRICYC